MTKIDIFSGFLGAGKTTLIKKMLGDAYAGEKIVLIENEFGEIGIDGGFLRDAGIEINEMNSGCICCSLVGDFGEALIKVLDEYKPDRILIEPSGVGKLSDVVAAVEGVKTENAILNGATVVVDAAKCKMYMKNFGEFFNNQIENATCIVLSHTSKLSDEKIAAAVALIKEHNDTATVVTTEWDELDGKTLLAAMERTNTLSKALEELEHSAKHHHHDHDEECECGCHHDHHHHHHDHDEECECGCHHEHHHHDHDEECECGCHHEHHYHDHDEECECGCHHEHHHHDHDEECECGHHHEHHHHDHDGECECGHDHEHHHHHHDHDEECECGHHHEHHHHDHDEECECGCHHHGHEHHHHHADEVFASWGVETVSKYTAEQIENILKALENEEKYGFILRAKGIVSAPDGKWINFDYVPGEPDVREGSADVIGRICVIGSKLDKSAVAELFGIHN